jgi:hypothetical protein
MRCFYVINEYKLTTSLRINAVELQVTVLSVCCCDAALQDDSVSDGFQYGFWSLVDGHLIR